MFPDSLTLHLDGAQVSWRSLDLLAYLGPHESDLTRWPPSTLPSGERAQLTVLSWMYCSQMLAVNPCPASQGRSGDTIM